MLLWAWIAIAWTLVLWGYERRVLLLIVNDFPENFSSFVLGTVQAGALGLAALWFWASFISRWEFRLVYGLLFLLAVLVEYGYVSALGRFALAQDYLMGVAVIDRDLVMADLKSFILQQPRFLFPVLGYAALLFASARQSSAGLGVMLSVMLATAAYYSLLFLYSRGTFVTLAFGAGLRTLIFTFWRWSAIYRGPRQAVSIPAAPPPAHNLIFVVDESVRWDHLSLNGYPRPTTPFLEELSARGRLYNWGLAVAGATMSLPANLLLLTGVQHPPDTAQNYRRWPTLFQYARALGYETYHIDAQTERRWLLSGKDLADVDHWVNSSAFQDVPGYDVDFAAARYIRQQAAGSTGKLFWVTKMGLHYPYLRRLPEQSALWRPIAAHPHYDPTCHEEIVNTYDSALAYNLDRFFEDLLGSDGLPDTTIVYTSDHGQTLSDNGELWPHTGATLNEVSVPLFIVTDQLLNVDTTYTASHANLFATLLDLMGVPPEARQGDYAPSLLQARGGGRPPRYYLNGDLESRANGKAMPFDAPLEPIL